MNKLVILSLVCFSTQVCGMQRFLETPVYTEVNPGGSIRLPCQVESMKGECRWEKDGVPVGLYPGKYEMRGQAGDQLRQGAVNSGDCGLDILGASIEYDNGVWQCQVTASDFKQRDTLISEGAQLVVRVKPAETLVRQAGGGRLTDRLTARAGEEIELECVSEGGNPAPVLTWLVNSQTFQATSSQENERLSGGLWKSVAFLKLPVSRTDNGDKVECVAEHPALETPSTATIQLEIFYPPRIDVTISKSGALIEGSEVTLSCQAEANPPARITWRKLESGEASIIGTTPQLHLAGISKEDAGTYQCTAENELGLSKPSTIPVLVHYAPVIVGLGVSKKLDARAGEPAHLSCQVQGAPRPSIQWLQQTPTGEVLVRGYDEELVIESVSYQHQGSFVCSAKNTIGEVQSEPIAVQVTGKPEVDRLKLQSEYVLNLGDNFAASVEFCARPLPRVTWNLGPVGQAARTVELISGSTFERFHASNTREMSQHCFQVNLDIAGIRLEDSHEFELRIENDFGREVVHVRAIVVDTRLFTEEVFAAVVVGGVLTILLITVVIVYVVRSGCCFGKSNMDGIKGGKHDSGSDRTDLESCRSSTDSSNGMGAVVGGRNGTQAVLPPDALYGTTSKKNTYFEPEFNNSKEKLRPDLIRSEANSPYSSSGSYPNNHLYSPYTTTGISNPCAIESPEALYSSVKKKSKRSNSRPEHQYSGHYGSQRPEYRSQGVDCQLEHSSVPSSIEDILLSYKLQYKGEL